MPREQGDSGEFVETVPPEDVLDVFDAVDGPVVLSADVAEYFDVTRETARRKLQILYDRGTLDRRKVSRRVIYWRDHAEPTPDTAGDRTPARERPEDGATSTRSEPDPTPGEDTNAEHAALTGDEDLRESVRAYLDANDLPPKTAHGRAAVLDVFQYLRDHGQAKTGAIQDAVHPEYSDEWSTGRTMWNALDRHLENVPGVKKAGYGEWGYAGDEDVRELVQE